jgi:D-glycero-alpha-D-manno-heptose-7-phosphate kinase
VSVGLIKALVAACGLNWTSQDVAELASYIEIEKLKSPIGKQDQYAAAFGGLNLIEFEEKATRITPLELSREQKRNLGCSLMIFYTGQSRSANSILAQQKEASKKKSSSTVEALHNVKLMVPKARKCLELGDIKGFGQLLHENWLEKKRFAKGVSNQLIDDCYKEAMRAGAYGGKITGAGGGGFLLICCNEFDRIKITEALEKRGLIRVGFHLDDVGATVVMNSGLLLTSRFSWQKPEELRRLVA